MSLTISNSLHTNKSVIHRPDHTDMRVKPNHSLTPRKSLNQIIVIPRQLILPAHLKEGIGDQTDEALQEEIEYLISKLDLIASEKLDCGIGFRPQQKDHLDIKLGNEAKDLSKTLLERPNPVNVQDAKRFIKRLKLIDKLEGIRKERHLSAIGFRLDENKKKDVQYGNKANELARNLKISSTKENIKAAMEFISVDEIINTLEDIAQEKAKTNIGIIRKPQSKEDETLEKLTQALADRLKEEPDEATIETAVNLINLLLLAESLKDSSSEGAEPGCYGLHCSLPDKYALAA